MNLSMMGTRKCGEIVCNESVWGCSVAWNDAGPPSILSCPTTGPPPPEDDAEPFEDEDASGVAPACCSTTDDDALCPAASRRDSLSPVILIVTCVSCHFVNPVRVNLNYVKYHPLPRQIPQPRLDGHRDSSGYVSTFPPLGTATTVTHHAPNIQQTTS